MTTTADNSETSPGGFDDWETPCPNTDDNIHCEHWYDAYGCHQCGDPPPICPRTLLEEIDCEHEDHIDLDPLREKGMRFHCDHWYCGEECHGCGDDHDTLPIPHVKISP